MSWYLDNNDKLMFNNQTVYDGRYIKADYIEFDVAVGGQAFIDTGITDDSETLWNVNFEYVSIQPESWIVGTSDLQQSIYYAYCGNSQANSFYYNEFNGYRYVEYSSYPPTAGVTYTSTKYDKSHYGNRTYTTPYNIIIGGRNWGSSETPMNYSNGGNAHFKVKYFELQKNGIWIMQMFPAYDPVNEEWGMYDAIGGQFYGNAGAEGTFIAGGGFASDVNQTLPLLPYDIVNKPLSAWYISDNDTIEADIIPSLMPWVEPYPYGVWYMDDNDTIEMVNYPTVIERGAFVNCHNLTKVEIPDSVTKIGRYAFRHTGLTEVTISRSCSYYPTSFPEGCQINYSSPVKIFTIDTTRYDVADGYVYDTRGNKIAETGITSDTNTNAVNSYGIRFNNNTYCITDPDAVYLPTDYPWTITCRLKDIWEGRYNGGSNVFGLYNGSTKVFNVFMNTNNLTYLINGGNVATPTNGYCGWSGSDSIGYIETTIVASNEMCAWNNEIKMICDTEKIYVYLNGLKELEFPVSAFGDKIDKILLGHNEWPTPFTITYFAISDIAEPIDRIVYKWDITRKGADNYFSVAKLYLYTKEEGGTYSGDVGARPQNYVFAAGPPTRPDERAFPTELAGIGTYRQNSFRLVYGNGVYNVSPNGALTVYMTCPLCNEYGKPDASINTVKALAYQYLTPNEPFDQRHPIDWTLQASLDGGITWQTLDTQTNQGYPGQNALSPVYTITWPN